MRHLGPGNTPRHSTGLVARDTRGAGWRAHHGACRDRCRVPYPLPLGMGDLARNLGFERIVELDWWESFSHRDWKVTLVPSKHWGARVLRDRHRGYGGFILEHQGRCLYHAGDSAYFEGFKEIGKTIRPEIALLPIGAYHPESFRHVHMGPDEAIKVFKAILISSLLTVAWAFLFRGGFSFRDFSYSRGVFLLDPRMAVGPHRQGVCRGIAANQARAGHAG